MESFLHRLFTIFTRVNLEAPNSPKKSFPGVNYVNAKSNKEIGKLEAKKAVEQLASKPYPTRFYQPVHCFLIQKMETGVAGQVADGPGDEVLGSDI
jgi:hypothetical protein